MDSTTEVFCEKLQQFSPEILLSKENLSEEFIDANEEEIFTLESFISLLMQSRNREKDFLIAKVETPAENNQIYKYYYSATELNKVLFRYETERRLLHRMRVRNPINNMYIIGQVLYYRISPEEVDRNLFKLVDDSHNLFKKSISLSDLKKSDGMINLNIFEEIKKQRLKKNEKLVFTGEYFANDDDFLLNAEMREYFRDCANEPDDEFLFELDRTNNDLFALLEDNSDPDGSRAYGWRRIFSVHVMILLSLLSIILILGSNPVVIIITLPIAIIALLSFFMSLIYVLCIRRSTFDSLAVESVEQI